MNENKYSASSIIEHNLYTTLPNALRNTLVSVYEPTIGKLWKLTFNTNETSNWFSRIDGNIRVFLTSHEWLGSCYACHTLTTKQCILFCYCYSPGYNALSVLKEDITSYMNTLIFFVGVKQITVTSSFLIYRFFTLLRQFVECVLFLEGQIWKGRVCCLVVHMFYFRTMLYRRSDTWQCKLGKQLITPHGSGEKRVSYQLILRASKIKHITWDV